MSKKKILAEIAEAHSCQFVALIALVVIAMVASPTVVLMLLSGAIPEEQWTTYSVGLLLFLNLVTLYAFSLVKKVKAARKARGE
jgi:hypothetical protein